jgi:antitoxin (DNA-binding transcriptional repressor) of toxin-antitoxin stability system
VCYRDAMSDTPEGERSVMPAGASPAEPEPAEPEPAGPFRDPGRPAARAQASPQAEVSGRHGTRAGSRRRIGIRELRQHASVWVDLAERGYTVDITNRGRLVAQLVPAREPGSPLERLVAAGIVEPAEEPGGVGDIEPYPAPAASRGVGRGGTRGETVRAQGWGRTSGGTAGPEGRL